ncbi:snare associated Golgi protein-domain-containing protein [Leucosporidium creatinivorum]|uniref:Golgi apparatus membrane protein TVP38 n=1 Tax=Leucosporidium creatinivorum TaxID=106004 RepID=A0A1Y2DFN6_9BASI|nr:snare associated Golgi protein-domain-containing protein [Leucosporidium creatinivorum]
MGFHPVQSIKNEWYEAKEAGKELWHFTKTHDWKRSARQSVQRKYWLWWIVGIILTGCLVAISIYRDTIVEKFEPHKDTITSYKWSWVVPVVVLFILSFPPLGGHEIVLLVVGLIWGLWVGFAIACAGTFLGELGCYVMFRYFFTEKAQKIEEKSVFYACLARLMRDGGLWIIIVIRFSAVPGHVVTAIQSTVGMSIWVYSIAVAVSLPKQLAVVYLGVMFGETSGVADPATIHKQRIISLSVFFGTCVATLLALYIVYMRARKLYPQVLLEANERKAAKGEFSPSSSTTDLASNPHANSSFEVIHVRPSLAEAIADGDPAGPFADPPFDHRQTYAAALPLPGSPGPGPPGLSASERHTAIPMVPTQAGGGAWMDGRMRGERGWSEVEERERRQYEEEQRRQGGGGGRQQVYGGKLADVAGASNQSFARLPMEGSEVGASGMVDAGGYGQSPYGHPQQQGGRR